jgi:hypothetical protein
MTAEAAGLRRDPSMFCSASRSPIGSGAAAQTVPPARGPPERECSLNEKTGCTPSPNPPLDDPNTHGVDVRTTTTVRGAGDPPSPRAGRQAVDHQQLPRAGQASVVCVSGCPRQRALAELDAADNTTPTRRRKLHDHRDNHAKPGRRLPRLGWTTRRGGCSRFCAPAVAPRGYPSSPAPPALASCRSSTALYALEHQGLVTPTVWRLADLDRANSETTVFPV